MEIQTDEGMDRWKEKKMDERQIFRWTDTETGQEGTDRRTDVITDSGSDR